MHSSITPKGESEETDTNNNITKDAEFDEGITEKALDNDGNVIIARVWIIIAIQRVVE